jgi:GT2 family glycosyltransferase
VEHSTAMNGRVTVVMPTLNQGVYLERAARSVLEQGNAVHELLIVDGGSTDTTLATLADLGAEFPHTVRWYSCPDDGPAAAVNFGVQHARGDIIGWLNSDDLYAPRAVQRALEHLRANPDHVMVYGHAEHIDACGNALGGYPTQLPAAGLSGFRDGCYICQPTAFVRRPVFLELGGLNRALRASFDFDLWLRLFARHADAIGFVPRVQAYSRMHAHTITARFRRDVALEGLEQTARHFGTGPAHWILTHMDELCAAHPFHPEPVDLVAALNELADRASASLSPGDRELVRQRIDDDRNLQLARADLYVGVHADGWAGRVLDVRLLQGSEPVEEIRLQCRHAAPGADMDLQLTIVSPGGEHPSIAITSPGEFELCIPVEDRRPGARLTFRVSSTSFVPAAVEPGSADTRDLAFVVEACELIRTVEPAQEYAN